jgi:hypothetical protein
MDTKLNPKLDPKVVPAIALDKPIQEPKVFFMGRQVQVLAKPPKPKLLALIIHHLFRHSLPEGWGLKIK